MPANRDSDADKLDALGRVTSSYRLKPGGRTSELLSYLVGEHVEGRGDQIKAVTIAQDVFGKGAEFDAARDSSVRVEVKRLRDFLDQYYASEGIDDPMRISIPKGSYQPEFEANCPEPKPAPEPVAGVPPKAPGWRRWAYVGGAVVMVTIGGALFAVSAGPNFLVQRDPDYPRVLIQSNKVLPSVLESSRDVLARFSNISVLNRPPRPWNSYYLLEFTALLDDRIAATITDVEMNHILSTHSFGMSDFSPHLDDGGLTEFQTWMGRHAIRNGPIMRDFADHYEGSKSFNCLLLTEDYFSYQSDASHLAARDCLLGLVETGAATSIDWVNLAFLYREEASDQRNLLPGEPLERAIDAARRAVDLAPNNAEAYYALMTVLFSLGNTANAIRAGEEAVRLNPYDGEIVGGFAARLVTAGEYERALYLFRLSDPLGPYERGWRTHGIFLANLALGNDDLAADIALGLRGRENPLYIASLAVADYLRGDLDSAKSHYRIVIASEPEPIELYERRHYEPELINKLRTVFHQIEIAPDTPPLPQ